MKIHTIDQEFLGHKHVIASFLVEGPDGFILIETGPASTKDVLERKVQELGVPLEEIRHVLVSHIHLDHSGGAGYWAKRGSKIYVHPKGARHLISPEKLLSSASRIYLDRMDELWGTTLAIPEEQVVELGEGVHEIAGLKVEALDTPGHAGHHLAFLIGDALFTGDVAACRLPGSNYVSVPAPPPEFKLEVWLSSLDKVESRNAKELYLTHFGRVEDAAQHLTTLRKRLHDCVAFVEKNREQENLAELYQSWDREQAALSGVEGKKYDDYEAANPSFMSAQGIVRYLKKRDELCSK